MSAAKMNEEVERYKRLLDDWDRGKSGGKIARGESPISKPSKPTAPPKSSGRAKLKRPAAAEEDSGRFSKGAILCLDDEELLVYRRPVTGETYDMVYSLLATGEVKIESVELGERKVEVLGQLSSADLKNLQEEMHWSHGLIAGHCECPDARERIPSPGASKSTIRPTAVGRPSPAGRPTPTRPPRRSQNGESNAMVNGLMAQEGAARVVDDSKLPQTKVSIRRGQMVTLRINGQKWEAVYWGKDKKGTVVAHRTHNHWALMHLDLARYKNSISVTGEPDECLMDQISAELKAAKSEAT